MKRQVQRATDAFPSKTPRRDISMLAAFKWLQLLGWPTQPWQTARFGWTQEIKPVFISLLRQTWTDLVIISNYFRYLSVDNSGSWCSVTAASPQNWLASDPSVCCGVLKVMIVSFSSEYVIKSLFQNVKVICFTFRPFSLINSDSCYVFYISANIHSGLNKHKRVYSTRKKCVLYINPLDIYVQYNTTISFSVLDA